MAVEEAGTRVNLSMQESYNSPYPTTTTFRPHSARIAILKQCRKFSDDVLFNQTFNYPLNPTNYGMSGSFMVIQLIVAVEDEGTSEIWACDTSPEVRQMVMTGDGMFRIVAKVMPDAHIFSSKLDFKGKQLPAFAGNLTFLLPVKSERPLFYTTKIQLLHKISDYHHEVLDEKTFWNIRTHDFGTNPRDFQSGRTIFEVEKPIPKIKLQGVLASKIGREVRMHFQNLGDNGQYNKFLLDKQNFVQRYGRKARFKDLVLTVQLEEAIMNFGQNKMDDCQAICEDVCDYLTRHNSGNWPFLLTKAFYIISAIYRQAGQFDKADEYMEWSCECAERAVLNEETAVNCYNAAALLAEKSAAVGITPAEELLAERLFEEACGFWIQQKENESMRCVNRTLNRLILFLLKASRTKFPDMRKPVSRAYLGKAWETIWKCERDLMSQCPKRLKATFLIAKADYFIRKATMEGSDIVEQQRREDFLSARTVLQSTIQICQDLRMQTEIEGIRDRMRNIEALSANGLQWLNVAEPADAVVAAEIRNQPVERSTSDIHDLINMLLLQEEEQNRRSAHQCTE